MKPLSLCVVLLATLACSGSPTTPPSSAPRTASASLTAMPPKLIQECQRYEKLKPACPSKVPEIANPTFRRAQASRRGRKLWAFFAEWNAPLPGLTARNAPPAFAHVNVFAGEVERVLTFSVEQASEGKPPAKRDSALSFGDRTWNERSGEVLLAPPYPHGGIEGDHLIFWWTENGREYSVSLHAWNPLEETEATLREIMQSLPRF